jgi:hypothetical protein
MVKGYVKLYVGRVEIALYAEQSACGEELNIL